MKKLSWIALTLFVPLAVTAACGDLATQAAMNDCAARELRRTEAELAKVYDSFSARLDERQRQRLAHLQAAWVRYRDLACAFETSGAEGGGVHAFVLRTCLAGSTRARTEELSTLAGCEEGDLACPAPRPGRHACRERADRVGPCFAVDGRARLYDGTPSVRIWSVGTRRLLGVIGDEDGESPDVGKLPPELARRRDWGGSVCGRFEVCPRAPDRPGTMRPECVQSVSRLEVRLDEPSAKR